MFGDGCTKMLFALGFIDPGFIPEIPNSLKKLQKVLDLYAKQREGLPWEQMIMLFVLMKRPVSRPEFASIRLLLHVLESR